MSKKSLPLRIFNLHVFYMKLGSKLGSPFIKFTAYIALWKQISNGGLESVAYCCYYYMIKEGEKEHGAQTRMREIERRKRNVR
jgi:hypothetical protein